MVVSELYAGYPAQESGQIFVGAHRTKACSRPPRPAPRALAVSSPACAGDVLISVNDVRVTEVDMATQVIKLAKKEVVLRTTNVYQMPSPSASNAPIPAAANPPPPPPPPPPPAPPPGGAVVGDLLGDFDCAPAPAPAPAPATRNDFEDFFDDPNDFMK